MWVGAQISSEIFCLQSAEAEHKGDTAALVPIMRQIRGPPVSAPRTGAQDGSLVLCGSQLGQSVLRAGVRTIAPLFIRHSPRGDFYSLACGDSAFSVLSEHEARQRAEAVKHAGSGSRTKGSIAGSVRPD